ncbi:hypothetical protein [Virgibacillus sp. DJP39]|uniref:hypothetical protein n=1 Tax=Virgibacillus sp. DJP39 TaxID=3409790 RepID=UPI003BB4A5F1
MKFMISLTMLFITATISLLHTTSFTTAEVKNNTKLSVVSEENALVAITYTNSKQFVVTNNTSSTIKIERIEVSGEFDHEIVDLGKKGSHFISPGAVQPFNITGDPNKLTGKVIQVTTNWNNGSAVIKSTIPDIK